MALYSLPTALVVPRPPATAGTLEDFRAWASSIVGYLSNLNAVTEGLTEAFITSSAQIGTDVITTDHFLDSAITSAKIQDSGVLSIDLGPSSVTSIKIQSSAVTSAAIAAAAVYTSHLTAAVVQTVNVQDSAVTTPKLQFSSVTTGAVALTAGNLGVTNGGFTTIATVAVTLATSELWTVIAGCDVAITDASAGLTVDHQLVSSAKTYLQRQGLGGYSLVGLVSLIAWKEGGLYLGGQFSSGDSGVINLNYQIQPNAASTSSASVVASQRLLRVEQFKR